MGKWIRKAAVAAVLMTLPVMAFAAPEPTALWSLEGHERTVFVAAFSSDGKMLATAGLDTYIILWDVVAGKEIARLNIDGMGDAVRRLAFSADGKTLAASGQGVDVQVFDVEAKKLRKKVKPSGSMSGGMALSPDGKRVAVTSMEEVELLDVATGKRIGGAAYKTYSGPKKVVYSPDGKRVAVEFWEGGTSDSTIIMADGETGKKLGEIPATRKQTINSLAFSTDGKTLAAGAMALRFYNTETLKLTTPAPSAKDQDTAFKEGTAAWISYSADGKSLAWGSSQIVWADPKTAKTLKIMTGDGNGMVQALSPDHKLAAVTLGSRKVIVTKVTPGAAGQLALTGGTPVSAEVTTKDAKGGLTIVGSDARIRRIELSPDGKTVYSVGLDTVLAAWDASSGKQLWKTKTDISTRFSTPMVLMDNGKSLLVGTSGRLFDAGTGKQAGKLEVPFSSEVTGNGKRLAVSPGAKQVLVFESGKPKPIRTITTEGNVRSLVMSGDGQWVAWEEYGKVILASAADGQVKAKMDAVEKPLGLALSADGKLIIISSTYEMNLFEVETKKKLWTVKHFAGKHFAFSPDGKQLLASGLAQAPFVVVRETATGKAVGQVAEVEEAAGMFFMPDGKSVVVPANDRIRVVPIGALEPYKE